MLRLVRSRSMRIFAITGIAEIDIAVARNRLNSIRLFGSARYCGGHEVTEPEAEAERQDHAHHRGDERGATEVAQQPQVRLETGQQQQQAHADGAERVQQVELVRVGREDRRERVRKVVPEQARSQRDAGGQLAHHGRQPEPLRNLRPDARHRHQQRELHQQQEHGVAGQARDWIVQAAATVAWEIAPSPGRALSERYSVGRAEFSMAK